jgi:hypothetical protein
MTLFEAVEAQDAAELKKAIKAVRDVNEAGEGGRTALIEAAMLGRADLCELLLDAGAEPSLTDDEKETALLKAAANGHRSVVELLGPLGSDDERDMAGAFLKAHGKSHGPEFQGPEASRFQRAAATASARVSKFVGHDSPGERLDRVHRSEDNASRKKR